MTPEQWRQVTTVFHGALGRPSEARAAFLDAACGTDRHVREEVERLLAAHVDAGRFGETPGQGLAGLTALDAEWVDGSSAILSAMPEPSILSGEEPRAADDERAAPLAPGARRFLAVVWLAAAFTLASFSYVVWLLIMSGGATPAFGWTEARREGQWIVTSVDPAGPAAGLLQPDDRLIGINGGPLATRAGTVPYRRGMSAGDTYRLAVVRQGIRLEHPLQVGVGPTALTSQLAYFFSSLVWCIVGLFIGFARPDQPVARLAFGAAVTTGLGFIHAVFVQSGPLFHPMHVVLGCHFFCRFPDGRPTTGRWRAALMLMYVTGAGPFLLGLWLHATRLAQGAPGAVELLNAYAFLFGHRGLVATYVFYASLALMVSAVAHNYRRLTTEGQRRRVRWVAYGSVLGLAPQIAWSVAEVLTGPRSIAWMDTSANVVTAIIPLVVAYAVVKHRVLDIKVVVRRGLQYLLARRVLQAAAVLPTLALTYTIVRHRDVTIAELASDTQASLYWLAAAAVVLTFRGPIERSLDRRFFREEYDTEQLLVGLLDEVRKADSIAELSRVVGGRLAAALHPTSACLWYRDPDEHAASGAIAGVPSTGGWQRWLEQRGEPATLPMPADAGLSPREARWFRDHHIGLVVPIMDSDDRLVGAMLLGDKKSEEPYDVGDRRLLSAVARQVAVVRENLRLRARVDDEARVRHDVLARLDARGSGLLKECPVCGECFDADAERCAADGHALTLTLPVPRIVDGKYRLDRLLGTGGMGAVYAARDLRLARDVAVKILLGRAFGQRDALRRFRREAQAAARLNHPNIVAVHDVGSLEGDGAYLVMERVHGVTLRAELEHCGALTPAIVAEWADPLLAGLEAAHAAGIVHRDMKPENVMGHRDGAGVLTVKLLDLGLAKLRIDQAHITATITAAGVAMGTIGYMSPEQIFGGEVDARTDLFAVGVILIEALTGQRPVADAVSPVFRPVELPAWRRLAESPAPEGRALHTLLTRCVAADPGQRVPTARALRELVVPLLRVCPPLAA